jgi:hypothetical protein
MTASELGDIENECRRNPLLRGANREVTPYGRDDFGVKIMVPGHNASWANTLQEFRDMVAGLYVNHQTSFLDAYVRYQTAKQRGLDVRTLALLALTEIHRISGVSAAEDRSANMMVMHRLLVQGLGRANQADTHEMYDQLRKDAGIESVDAGASR